MKEENITILLVEDDPNLGMVLAEYLRFKGYKVTACKDGEEGLKAFKKGLFDMCILDVMMPKLDGFTLLREIRKINKQVPALFLTAKSLKEDVINGLKLGADDYITKPFSMEELTLRMHAVLKRSASQKIESENESKFTLGSYLFNYDKKLLTGYDNIQKLSSKEAELLRLLAIHMNGILNRSVALKQIWGDDTYFNARSMDVYIAKLRKRLKDDTTIEIINIHGEGFKLFVGKQNT